MIAVWPIIARVIAMMGAGGTAATGEMAAARGIAGLGQAAGSLASKVGTKTAGNIAADAAKDVGWNVTKKLAGKVFGGGSKMSPIAMEQAQTRAMASSAADTAQIVQNQRSLSLPQNAAMADGAKALKGPGPGERSARFAAMQPMPAFSPKDMQGFDTDEIKARAQKATTQNAAAFDGATSAVKKFAKALGPLGLVVTAAAAPLLIGNWLRKRAAQDVLANREYAKFSPTMAAAYAQRDFQQLQLDISTARRTGGTGGLLARQANKLQAEWQPWKEMGKDVSNLISSGITTLEVGAFRLIEIIGITKTMQGLLEAIKGYLGIQTDTSTQLPMERAWAMIKNGGANAQRPNMRETDADRAVAVANRRGGL